MMKCKLHGEYSVFCSECDEELVARHGHDNYSELLILREKVQIMRNGLKSLATKYYSAHVMRDIAITTLHDAGFLEDIE